MPLYQVLIERRGSEQALSRRYLKPKHKHKNAGDLGLAYQSFENLDVWKRACRLAVRVYAELKECKDYGLRDQMTRAAVSIPSNIAEGAERNSTREYIRFLHIAKGSAAELRTQLYIAERIDVIQHSVQKELTTECKEISAMLQALASSKKLDNKNPQDKIP